MAVCNSYEECKAFDYELLMDKCHLKSVFSTKVHKAKFVLFVKDIQLQPLNNFYDIWENKGIVTQFNFHVDEWNSHSKVVALDECLTVCNLHSGCKAFNYILDTRECFLRSQFTSYTVFSGGLLYKKEFLLHLNDESDIYTGIYKSLIEGKELNSRNNYELIYYCYFYAIESNKNAFQFPNITDKWRISETHRIIQVNLQKAFQEKDYRKLKVAIDKDYVEPINPLLLKDLSKANELKANLDQIRGLQKRILKLDAKCIADLNQYNQPSTVVHLIIKSTLLILSIGEVQTDEWKECRVFIKYACSNSILKKI
ncbi:DgyrCDS14721 [Dimorphilus gyrociliatus]|uniref:DgyrCDS14721 n=1 Tax=Dimorphilus gyrociliatus TaxID=2664684 RepID=A0A7I8WEU4_9ANNE|nr:DgyrCDS14721 [Dimorphilus gyrociliatus]